MTQDTKQDQIVAFTGGLALGVAALVFMVAEQDGRPLMALIFAAVPAVLATLIYAFLAPWYRSTLGRILLALVGTVAMLLVLAITNGYMGEYPYRFHLSLSLILIAGVAQWLLLAYVSVAQLGRRGVLLRRRRRGLLRRRFGALLRRQQPEDSPSE